MLSWAQRKSCSLKENPSQLHDCCMDLLVFGYVSFSLCVCVCGGAESCCLCPHVKPRVAKNNTRQSAVDWEELKNCRRTQKEPRRWDSPHWWTTVPVPTSCGPVILTFDLRGQSFLNLFWNNVLEPPELTKHIELNTTLCLNPLFLINIIRLFLFFSFCQTVFVLQTSTSFLSL